MLSDEMLEYAYDPISPMMVKDWADEAAKLERCAAVAQEVGYEYEGGILSSVGFVELNNLVEALKELDA